MSAAFEVRDDLVADAVLHDGAGRSPRARPERVEESRRVQRRGVDGLLDRTSGAAGSSALSMAAAEAALITGQDDKACAVRKTVCAGQGPIE